MAHRVKLQGSHRELGAVGVLDASRAQAGMDPGHKLSRTEGLGHIVVGPKGEAYDLVGLAVFGRQEHNGHAGRKVPDLLAGLKSVHDGHHKIKDHQVRTTVCKKTQGLLPIAGTNGIHAVSAHEGAHKLDDGRIIVGY